MSADSHDSHDPHAPASSGGDPVPHEVPGGITRGRLVAIGGIIVLIIVIIVGLCWNSGDDKETKQAVKTFTSSPNSKEASGFNEWLMAPTVPGLPQSDMDCPTVPAMKSPSESSKPVPAVVPSQFYHLTVATLQVGEAGWVKVCGNVGTCDKRRAWVLNGATVLPTAPVGQEKEYVLISRLATGFELNFGQRTDPLPMIQGPEGSKPGDKLLGWTPIAAFAPPPGGKG